MGLEPGRGFAHDVEKAVMDARLVEDDVREFRQPVLDVLHPAPADDEDIDLFRHAPRCARGLNALGGIGDFRIARLKSIQMELHEPVSRECLVWILISMLTISILVNDGTPSYLRGDFGERQQ